MGIYNVAHFVAHSAQPLMAAIASAAEHNLAQPVAS
jgi:hypothetical protein